MSLEKAAAILDAANTANPLLSKPGVNPDEATLVVHEKKDGVIQETPKEEPKEEVKEEPKLEEKPKEEPKRDEQVSQKFAMLAKKEKAIFKERERLKQEHELINQKAQALANFEAYKLKVKENPMLALQELGLTYADITEFQLSGKLPNAAELEIREVKSQIEDLRREREEEQKKRDEDLKKSQELEVQQTIAAFREEIADYINSNSEKYELTALYKADNLVYSVIDQHFQKTKRIMSKEEGANIVEKYLEEQFELGQKAKKIQAKAKPQPKGEAKPSPNAQQRTTMTNDMTSSAPSFLPAKSEQERIQRALAKLSQAP